MKQGLCGVGEFPNETVFVDVKDTGLESECLGCERDVSIYICCVTWASHLTSLSFCFPPVKQKAHFLPPGVSVKIR